jgi:hypothetical protein
VKQILCIFTIISLLTVCNQNSATTYTPKVDSVTVISDTMQMKKDEKVERKIVVDSLIFYNDSLFGDIELNFTEISENVFQACIRRYKTGCVLDSGHFISGSDLFVIHECSEICETYLAEKTTNRKMLMPSNYDAGILKMLLSPTCNQLIVCSSYDGPDYANYYEYRAEIFVFNITTESGLQAIKPTFKYYTSEWSIDDLTWVNDKTIALKIYEGNRGGDGSGAHYKYFKADMYK